ncbi:MAG: MFS transporter [Candidatus Handelsmanbacteria bacterium]|nr:MFS transporter [Candidatus Handelsmanbacteria bacterium]
MSERHDPYAAFRHRNYTMFMAGAMLAQIGGGGQGLAIGWELYQRTGQPLALGMAGLAQALPMIVLTPLAGYLADRFDRKHLLILSILGGALMSAALALLSVLEGPLWMIYALLALNASVLTLGRPARVAILPLLVPREIFENAVAWRTSAMQVSAVTGPALGGLIIAFSVPAAYLASAASAGLFALLLALLHLPPAEKTARGVIWSQLVAGVHFVRGQKLILAAISLDLFAVLLGGATYLLPVYATDVLKVGEKGLGLMQAAPAVGALLTALLLAHRPPMQRAGRTLLLAVAGFGVATILFGLSTNIYLSLFALFLTGVCDNVSVVVRHTLIQLLTPDAMRGRVAAVNGIFIGSSNELGGFESGLVAQAFSPVVSVVSGGIGCLLVVGATAIASPQLRRFTSFSEAVEAQQARQG